MRRITKLISAIILATVALVGAPSFWAAPSAWAAVDEVTWSVRPADGELGSNRSTLLLSGAPGAQQRDALTITNYSDRELALEVYAATATLGADGIPVAGAREDTSSADAANWVEFAQDAVSVPAGSSVTLPFTVTVPFNAEPGDHAVALLTSWISDEDIAVDRRLGIRGYFRVGGETAPSASVHDVRVDAAVPADPFAPRDVAVTFTLRNSGNMRLTSTAAIVLRDLLGRDLGGALAPEPDGEAAYRLADDTVPDLGPGESVAVRAVFEAVAAPVAVVAADITVVPTTFAQDDVLDEVSASGWALSIPWTAALAVLLVVAGTVLIPVLRRRSRTRFEQRVAEAVREQEAEPVASR